MVAIITGRVPRGTQSLHRARTAARAPSGTQGEHAEDVRQLAQPQLDIGFVELLLDAIQLVLQRRRGTSVGDSAADPTPDCRNSNGESRRPSRLDRRAVCRGRPQGWPQGWPRHRMGSQDQARNRMERARAVWPLSPKQHEDTLMPNSISSLHSQWGGGGGTRPWWLALLACGGAFWPLAFEPSAMTTGHPGEATGGGGDFSVMKRNTPRPPPLEEAWAVSRVHKRQSAQSAGREWLISGLKDGRYLSVKKGATRR